MKISNNIANGHARSNYSQPKTNPPTQKCAFKGWAAAPIKEIYLQPNKLGNFKDFLLEMDTKCKKYFNIIVQLKEGLTQDIESIKTDDQNRILNPLSSCWSQDNKIFINNNKLGFFPDSKDPHVAQQLAKNLNIETHRIASDTQGGNCYLGKKPNGETFALVGEDALEYSSRKYVAESFGIKEENLKVISQPNFHIDMVVRPLTYPHVLVGDPDLTANLAKKTYGEKKVEFINDFKSNKYLDDDRETYSKTDRTVKELEELGFKPIRVPGLIDGERGVNFMNAIVHQQENGDLVYITNKTPIGEKNGVDFEELFKKDLQSKVPQIKDIIFIDAKGLVQNCLTKYQGGTHCMVCEKPDFEKWNELLKKQV